MENCIEVKNITKTFSGVYALKNVSFSIRRGEVHAVSGENGAGKSTLMKILGGTYSKDYGEIFIDGKKCNISSVDDAAKAGISVIYQEFNLIPELTVAENIFITDPPKNKIGVIDRKKRNKQAKEVLNSLNIAVDPDEYVKNLSVSRKQMVEVAKALSHDASIIIMDEPTAALNDEEVESLFDMIKLLKSQGKTIIYISHRMKEIFDITDRITVLKDGQYVGTCNTADVNEDDIVKMMVGRDLDRDNQYVTHAKEDIIMSVKNFNRMGVYENISFNLHKGEILGIAGLMGCGREEIMSSIYGLAKADTGEIYIDGQKVKINSVSDAIAAGIGFVTDDRKDSGIMAKMSVLHNTTFIAMRKLKKLLGMVRSSDESAMLEKSTAMMNTKYASPDQKIMYLSGGNQQKVLLSRALMAKCKVLILLEPTRGIDVGAKAEIYKVLQELASTGIGIITVFSDLVELTSVCDRTLVIWNGKLMADLGREEFDKNTILTYAVGKNLKGGN